jgi:hypothetical protein
MRVGPTVMAAADTVMDTSWLITNPSGRHVRLAAGSVREADPKAESSVPLYRPIGSGASIPVTRGSAGVRMGCGTGAATSASVMARTASCAPVAATTRSANTAACSMITPRRTAAAGGAPHVARHHLAMCAVQTAGVCAMQM